MEQKNKKDETGRTPKPSNEPMELDESMLDEVTGGAFGAFGDVPRVKEYDYNDNIRSRV